MSRTIRCATIAPIRSFCSAKTSSTRERLLELALLARAESLPAWSRDTPILEHNESLPQPIKDIAWKAQVASVGNASSCVRGDCSWLEQSALLFGFGLNNLVDRSVKSSNLLAVRSTQWLGSW